MRTSKSLASRFFDYRVVIYENNSSDATPLLLAEWARRDPKVKVISEIIDDVASSRTEKISNARNKLLSCIKESQYNEFETVVIADLDFKTDWPIDAICETINTPGDWDGVFANGILSSGVYYDRYAFRDKEHPFGPELLANSWWTEVTDWERGIVFKADQPWHPVYSAFGGLGIYKRQSLLNALYSGLATWDLQKYMSQIIQKTSKENKDLKYYAEINGINLDLDLKDVPIVFRYNSIGTAENSPWVTCCEHLPFHALMSLQGHGNFYINPKMVMKYSDEEIFR